MLKKYYMTHNCVDCDKKISKWGIRCNSCAQKYRLKNPENAGRFIDGKCLKKYYCIDCDKEISLANGLYGKGRCRSCNAKQKHEIGILNSKGNNNPMFGIRKFGKNNPNWKDGKSNEPYPLEFNDELKLKIRKRDNFICQKCSITEEEHLSVYGRVLDVHHIDYNKENCNENNLITLCMECNQRVNKNRKYWQENFTSKSKEKNKKEEITEEK